MMLLLKVIYHIWTPVCELKAKANRLGFFTVIGFAAVALLITCLSTNFCINSASAQRQFLAQLSGKNEIPPVSSTATGVAKFQLSADGQTLDYQINVTNINAVMGAHIHSAKQDQNGPVVAGLFNPNMNSPPTGNVNGLLAKGTIKSSDLQGPLSGHSITELIHLINGHGVYVNIHTQQHQNGEIRGQIG
jgi:hypothetical protein